MPIYEYRCQACGHEMEAFVRSGKEPETCPECQSQLTRKISRAGVIFKGSGFYVNDSRGSSSGGASSAKGGDKKATAAAGSDTAKSGSEGGSSSSDSSSTSSKTESTSSTKSESSSKSAD